MGDTYKTIKAASSGKITEKMSRFLAFAHPVKSADEAKIIIKGYQNEYHDARHVCWAYMLGADRAEWQLNDNGEPSGTAGKPILGQINSAELTDIVIVVVRYFGGIKLGTPGLIAAYRAAARDAIDNAEIVEMHEMDVIAFEFGYIAMNDVMKIVKNPEIEVLERDFNNLCRMTIRIRKDFAPNIREKLSEVDTVVIA